MTPTPPPVAQTFRITGMDCADCARSIERGVQRLAGVDEAMLNFSLGTLKVSGEVAAETIVARVRELGYDVADEAAAPPGEQDGGAQKRGIRGFLRYLLARRHTTLALIGALLILPGMIFNEFLPMLGFEHPLFDVMSVAAWLTAGFPIARSAWRSLRINRAININVLMTIAAAGAVVIGAYTEAGLVIVLFAIGEALEGYTAAQARDSIRSLMQLAPAEATVLGPCLDCREHLGQDGYSGGPCPFCGLEEKRVAVSSLRVADRIIVKPGERIPMDGRVLAGQSSVNQAPITGESLPIDKITGAEVFAGSVNGEGVLEIAVTRLAADNTIARMIRLVEEAQAQQAPTQRFVDRFAALYTPAVVLLAALVAAIPPLFFAQPFWATPDHQGWLYRALALLVVACPCALVISTPVSLIAAISNAARHGVLIKGGAYLEALSQIKAIAFDKTGTLTSGQPALVQARAAGCADESAASCPQCDDLLALAVAVERRSEHPLARAVVAGWEQRRLPNPYPAPTEVVALAGRGVRGRVNGREVFIGSHSFFDANLIHDEHCRAIAAAAAHGHSAMLVSGDGRYLGYLTVADAVRPTGPAIIAELKRLGVSALVMLTGDDAATAAGVAQQVGVSDVRANLLPQDKLAAVQALLAEHGAVAMVGDGINDAPALAAATVGIAMAAAGTAQALETADIALMSDDLSKLPFALRLSRATMRIIRQNVAFSIGVKVVFLLLVLAGLGSMWLAVFADMGASLLVTLNGMRLLKRPG